MPTYPPPDDMPPIRALVTPIDTPASREGFIDLMEQAIAEVALGLDPDEDWAPMLLMQTTDSVIVADCSAYMESEDLKNLLGLVILPSLVMESMAYRAAISTCAWLVEGAHAAEVLAAGLTASSSKYRIEVMQVVVMDGDGWVQRMARVKRRRRSHPQLLAWRDSVGRPWDEGQSHQLAGRLVDDLATAVRQVNWVLDGEDRDAN